jgi:flagellar basal body-associated protein FliL
MADTQQVVREFLDLSVEEKREAKEALGMKEASEGVTNILWVMIVTAFVVVLLGGGYLLYDMSKNEQDTSVILPIITTVLGALVGLMAPSPVQAKK